MRNDLFMGPNSDSSKSFNYYSSELSLLNKKNLID